jgi:anti-sigma regulatory factor (Ser/Thr protein kinase)
LIPFVLELTSSFGIKNADRIIRVLYPLFEICKTDTVDLVLDMSSLSGFYPTGMAAVSAGLMHLKRQNRLNIVDLKQPETSNVHDYITRMGFYRHLDLEVEYRWNKRDSTGRFVEIAEVVDDDGVATTSEELGSIIEANFPTISKRVRSSLKIALAEVVENVFYHAGSPVNAIVCAQVVQRRREIEIAIVDCGRGIYSNMVNSPIHKPHCSNSNQAIRLATQCYITSTAQSHRGMGLYIASELTRRNNGSLFLASDDGILKIINGHEIPEHMCYNDGCIWPGTIVSFLFDLDRELSTVDVYNSMGPYPGEDDMIIQSEGE